MYKLKYLFAGMIVDHAIDFMYLKGAIESGYHHIQYFGAEAFLIYSGRRLIAKINKEDE